MNLSLLLHSLSLRNDTMVNNFSPWISLGLQWTAVFITARKLHWDWTPNQNIYNAFLYSWKILNSKVKHCYTQESIFLCSISTSQVSLFEIFYTDNLKKSISFYSRNFPFCSNIFLPNKTQIYSFMQKTQPNQPTNKNQNPQILNHTANSKWM